jgi:hypothetical protein
VETHFGDSARESDTSRTSSMKGGNFGTNGSDPVKNNIINPTFDTLTEEGRKVFKAYRVNFDELFLSRYEMMRQGAILKDTMLIIIHKAEVTLEVWPNPSFSFNDVQSMINSGLERQAKSTNELLHRLIEEQDGKKLDNSSINPSSSSSSSCTIIFTQTNAQTSGTSAGGATMLNPLAQSMNHFHNRTTIEGSAPTFGMPQQTMTSMFG